MEAPAAEKISSNISAPLETVVVTGLGAPERAALTCTSATRAVTMMTAIIAKRRRSSRYVKMRLSRRFMRCRVCFRYRQRKSQPAQRSNENSEREAHHRVKVAVDPLDERSAVALNAVRARLVHRLAGRDVRIDFILVQSVERHARALAMLRALASVEGDGERRMHQVRAAGEIAQHACGLGAIRRLIVRDAVDVDDRI